MQKLIIVGAGQISISQWIPSILRFSSLELIGVIDPDENARRNSAKISPETKAVSHINHLPGADLEGAIALVATPDHLPNIQELAQYGISKFIVEKPLVIRDAEVSELEQLVNDGNLEIYSIDHYYPKFFPLEYTLGLLNDLRIDFLDIKGEHRKEEIPFSLGKIEGITYTNIEAGDLGIPTLDTRPWLELDPKIGGMLRDLGTHAFGPLMRLGLLTEQPTIAEIHLAKFNSSRTGFTAVRSRADVEMWIRTLLISSDITLNITFGKAPFPGKERSLAVRASRGVFFAGLARGQSSVLLTNDGRMTRISLRRTESDLVLHEAVGYFSGKLPRSFDGNLNASLGALRLNQKLREKYFEKL